MTLPHAGDPSSVDGRDAHRHHAGERPEHPRQLADRIGQHYERHARDWDADRNRSSRALWIDKPWHDRFIDALPQGARVLDLGCGSGHPVAKHMAERGLRVTGVDLSPTLVSMCRQRLPDHEWLVADMRALDLARRFDGVLAWDSFFHLTPDDQRHMFEVFARHAAPAAVLMFNSGPEQGEVIGAYRGDPLYHASLSAGEYRERLADIGFEVRDHMVEDWETGGGRTVWLAHAP
jgi:SAM-dependent methyltransferase